MTATPLTFGTAGLRGPMREGLDAMNVTTVSRATWAVATVLKNRCLGGSTVVVGRDARHHSDEFAAATAEIFAAQGFSVVLLPHPAPTPVVAYAVRHLNAVAGVQITASHNPPADNGYKVYFDGGIQIVPPTDRDIETAMHQAPPDIARQPVTPADETLVDQYALQTAALRTTAGDVRVALTAMHGVGGALAVDVLNRAGITDIHTVAAQFDPEPNFPTVAFPNPEEPGATDLLLALATESDAEVAIALDPDADRCAVGIPTAQGWRMLSGNETGWLLGDYLLSGLTPDQARTAVVASSLVSSQLLAKIAARYGAHHVETLTGFKWLARADNDIPGATLRYAYEEAIGHCVDPDVVRDKDGISAAVVVCDLVAALRNRGQTIQDRLDALAARYGVHLTDAVSVHTDADAVMSRLRAEPPTQIAGIAVSTEDLDQRRGQHRTDALVFTVEGLRVAVRPSGTEPKVKGYIEISKPPAGDVAAARAEASTALHEVKAVVTHLLAPRG
ncbi:phospho-sugar mutase [Mycobacterium sp. CBMA293]|nr:phospho-sugar mutase [Mycolicibacterium sp. CBMA 360]MUL57488.1 phospho-sugar mutase [Mycolicibacterium sp. CBMA 335]MUL70528.1 phospho-sugar mutase [Mycolicibacterium sp. CBMA 311]MUL92576.1 phospho-sugar mutase [Mycolicibacterium sp. CBMA 230]MUM04952.1 phosphomannomutase [Mycolicibacterium sp. CBMA 213]MUM12341.1 phospho-sugar mutase [Mycolicibacterium sp. CBMA 293]MUM32344.1 phospho-sugar mutase [Mycolicibacterium sp. CBMA 361]